MRRLYETYPLWPLLHQLEVIVLIVKINPKKAQWANGRSVKSNFDRFGAKGRMEAVAESETEVDLVLNQAQVHRLLLEDLIREKLLVRSGIRKVKEWRRLDLGLVEGDDAEVTAHHFVILIPSGCGEGTVGPVGAERRLYELFPPCSVDHLFPNHFYIHFTFTYRDLQQLNGSGSESIISETLENSRHDPPGCRVEIGRFKRRKFKVVTRLFTHQLELERYIFRFTLELWKKGGDDVNSSLF